MRTTLNVDDDVLHAVQERAKRERRTAGQVLSELARQALTGPALDDGVQSHHGFVPLPHGGAVVTNAMIDRLREEEDE
ncbi:MAG: hypothetical protein ACR2FV_08215 [Ornithinimicrobium sp.]|jgi:hypothetical protein|uniref:hypothetical protein n=1 Tax=Ornithinimicrobium sp. TaxID=1977084 RepID=UPI003D9B7306